MSPASATRDTLTWVLITAAACALVLLQGASVLSQAAHALKAMLRWWVL